MFVCTLLLLSLLSLLLLLVVVVGCCCLLLFVVVCCCCCCWCCWCCCCWLLLLLSSESMLGFKSPTNPARYRSEALSKWLNLNNLDLEPCFPGMGVADHDILRRHPSTLPNFKPTLWFSDIIIITYNYIYIYIFNTIYIANGSIWIIIHMDWRNT